MLLRIYFHLFLELFRIIIEYGPLASVSKSEVVLILLSANVN